MFFKAFTRIFAQLHRKFHHIWEKVLNRNPHNRAGGNPPLRYVSVMRHACIAFVPLFLLKSARVVTFVFVGGLDVHFPCSAQVKTGMKGMLDEWSTQRARRVRVCAVRAMLVRNLGTPNSLRFPCVSIHPSLLFTGQKGKLLLVLASPCCCSKRLGLFCAVQLLTIPPPSPVGSKVRSTCMTHTMH